MKDQLQLADLSHMFIAMGHAMNVAAPVIAAAITLEDASVHFTTQEELQSVDDLLPKDLTALRRTNNLLHHGEGSNRHFVTQHSIHSLGLIKL